MVFGIWLMFQQLKSNKYIMTTEQIDIITTTQKIYCGREYEHNLTTNTQYNYI